jgi:hypothetical protein
VAALCEHYQEKAWRDYNRRKSVSDPRQKKAATGREGLKNFFSLGRERDVPDMPRYQAGDEDSGPLEEGDMWTLDCINFGATQRIREAFDDDSSGFVTVQEVNRLTQMRPDKWRFV